MSKVGDFLKAAEEFAEELRGMLAVERGINSEFALKAKLLASSLALARALYEAEEKHARASGESGA